MIKLFCMVLIFTSFSFADLDIGEDFEPGDLVSAEEFNLKFGKLKKVVGEIKDEELLGSWDCTNYRLTQNSDNNWFYQAETGRLILSELDSETSIASPKNWNIDTADIVHFGHLEGSYVLIHNELILFANQGGYTGNHPANIIGTYFLNMLKEDKITLSSDYGFLQNPGHMYSNILCEKI